MAPNSVATPYPVETIPPDGTVYRRVWYGFVHDGQIQVNAFKDAKPLTPHERPGMSVFWEKYAAPEDAVADFDPGRDWVVALVAGKIRMIDRLAVEHTPTARSQAHSDVYGEKTTEVRVMLRRQAVVVRRP
jgi:hypothetical protein